MRFPISSRAIRCELLRHLAGGLIALGCLLSAASAETASLDVVLARMDEAAATWAGMKANVRWVRYVSLVDDRREESGRIAVRESKTGNVQMLLAFTEPSAQFISVREAKVEIYKPKIRTVEEYDLRDSRDRLENALLLGFGTAGSYLAEHYEVVLAGEETVEGQPAVRLDLTPRNPDGEINNSRIEMWVSTELWQPVQQKVYDRNPADFRLFTYWEIETNPNFKAADFKLPLGKGTKRVRPQR